MASITVLPSELLARIVSFLDRSSLKTIRETSHLLSRFATPRLFDTLHLFPDERSYEAVDGITNDGTLKEMVKKVYVNTCEDDYDSQDEEEVELTENFKDRIAKFKDCPNVQNAVLRFDKHCSTQREWIMDRPETVAFRAKVLRVFFKWLASLEVPLRELGIRNMQDVNVNDDQISADIEKVLQNLRALRLSIVTEHNEAAPEDDLDLFPEPHDFFAQLPSIWLKPSASSLEHLTLYCDNYFGFYPKLDLSEVHFPHLKFLAFGNYCFVRDFQLEWILSHASTLTDLYFDDCAILYDVCLTEEHLANRGPFKKSEMETRSEDDGNTRQKYYLSYDKRWHDYFDSFRTKLPLLRQFRIGSSDWRHGVPFENEAEIKISLLENRYMACYDGYGPSPYLEPDFDPKEWEKEAPDCDEEDRDSLRLLLERTGQTVDKIHFMN